jgi:hypothetical protein
MSMYNGAQAKVKYNSDQFTLTISTIDLSIRVLLGDTLAPHLFVIVLLLLIKLAASGLLIELERIEVLHTLRSIQMILILLTT